MEKMMLKAKKFSNVQIVSLGYFCVSLVGTILLLLPISSHGETTVLQAIFTAVSASCVTGLVLVDTATHWTLFGQIVILLLIQVGGMGFMTIGIRFMQFFRKRISLREKEMMVEAINATRLGGITNFAKRIVTGTLIVEGIGALCLSIKFIPEFGLGKGIFYSIFHSISAFCNAGFDLMGIKQPYDSLLSYAGDPWVNFVIMMLITLGGLGFFVWEDILHNKKNWKKYYLHTKIVLLMSAILTFGGAIAFFWMETKGTGADLNLWERSVTALFQSVTCRTAGFNTVDTAALTDGSKILSMILMLIGGSSGSTAGGIKTTTIAVLLLFTIAGARGNSRPSLFGRSIEPEALQKAVAIFVINIFFVLGASFLICAWEGLAGMDVLFETFSAMGTVGMSTGITRSLGTGSASLIALIMFFGRVGSVSLTGALLDTSKAKKIMVPTEKIMIG
ncbi:TrkH family potassium uptake protein [Chakrabartyella piscis]|uniref:TrkH family potassium uptake protein n=1 Tax=Chakrabartyella piscis TaxID=2918914 RepID=UPI00295878F1|nr:potassium transporter TrkG [Chakrabartyella piscis]